MLPASLSHLLSWLIVGESLGESLPPSGFPSGAGKGQQEVVSAAGLSSLPYVGEHLGLLLGCGLCFRRMMS